MALRLITTSLAAAGAAGALALLPGCATPTTTNCGLIGVPNTDSGAYSITAGGTSCATAGAVAVGSRARRGAPYGDLGFLCPPALPKLTGLRTYAYSCTGPAGSKVSFVSTW